MLVAVVKRCSKCDATKSIDDFGKDSSTRDGRTNQCLDCRNARQRAEGQNGNYAKRNAKIKDYQRLYYKRPEVVRRVRNQQLLKSFGITVEQYDAMLEEQNGVCAICNKPQCSARNNHFAVDHDHDTGVIRGLLCDRCNRGIGLFGDDVTLLNNAIEYLNHAKHAAAD